MVVIRDYDVVVREDYDVWIPEHLHTGWQKLRGQGPSKSLDSDEKFEPQHVRYFVAIIRFVAVYAFFWVNYSVYLVSALLHGM